MTEAPRPHGSRCRIGRLCCCRRDRHRPRHSAGATWQRRPLHRFRIAAQPGTPMPSPVIPTSCCARPTLIRLLPAGLRAPGVSPYMYAARPAAPTRPTAKNLCRHSGPGASAIRADANGSATLPGVSAGTYYLMVSTRYNNQPTRGVSLSLFTPGPTRSARPEQRDTDPLILHEPSRGLSCNAHGDDDCRLARLQSNAPQRSHPPAPADRLACHHAETAAIIPHRPADSISLKRLRTSWIQLARDTGSENPR